LEFQKYNVKEKKKKKLKKKKKSQKNYKIYIYEFAFKKNIGFFFFCKVIVGYKSEN